MNNVDNDKKTAVTKMLAILGLVAILILVGWGSVRLISSLPGAFNSLASLTDGVYDYEPTPERIIISVGEAVVNTGDTVELAYLKDTETGTYYFSYECIDGVTVSHRSTNDPIECNELIELTEDVIALRLDSNQDRFVDVPLTISYVLNEEVAVSSDSVVTVVNTAINADEIPNIVLSEPEDEDATDSIESDEDETAATEEANADDQTEAVSGSDSAGANTTPQYEIITAIPSSNPNGYTDLSVQYLGVGSISGQQFQPAATLEADSPGAIRFQVKNLGTKTSDEWSFIAELPSGQVYNSNNQAPLRPNERAVLTIGFTTDDDEETADFSVEVIHSEVNQNNNDFDWSVTVE